MIEVSHVTKRFGAVMALSDASLRIERGERVALVGSNGSGKTTLLRAILGLTRVTGTVSIDGIDVAKSPERALLPVAYVPQIAPPLDAPVIEVVRVTSRLRDVPIAAIDSRAALLGLALSPIERMRFRDLSGGMKQKLLAALALALPADILICDEPTANLDGTAREAFFAQLDTRGERTITLLCSHRADEVARLVDRVVTLRDGRVVSDERAAPLPKLDEAEPPASGKVRVA